MNQQQQLEQIQQAKPIPSHPKYGVTKDGEVFNLETGRRLRFSRDRQGYVRAHLYVGNNKTKCVKVHRLVTETWVGPANGLDVNHKNGIKDDNRLENLEYCTRSENMRHAFAMGLKSTSEEMIKKLVKASKSRVRGKHQRARKVIDTANNHIYGSIIEAAAAAGISQTYLCAMMRGRCNNKTTMKYYE